MSVFCAHCHKRLILENLVIKTYQALKSYATCGDVTVEKNGRIIASVQSGKLTVKGTVQGRIEARGCVEVAGSGSLIGEVSACALVVQQGASVQGFCEIRPLPACAPAAVPAALPAGDAGSPGGPERAPERAPARKRTCRDEESGAGGLLPPEPADHPPKPKAVKAIVTTRRRSSTTPRR